MTETITNSTTAENNTKSTFSMIQWPQIFALLLLDFAVIISWIAYHEFQPKVLSQFGLNDFIVEFMILQGLIIVITPGVAGKIADNMKIRSGSSLGLVNVGISIVSLVFMSVALTVFINPTGPVKFILPVLIVFWLISMNLFRSPAISMIEEFAPQDQLPKVVALFVLFFDLAYALEPSIVSLLNFLGGPITFVVGGVLVFSTGMYLRSSFKKRKKVNDLAQFDNDTADGKSDFLTVILVSLGLGVATTLVFKYLPTLYELRIPDTVEYVGAAEYIVSALVALSAFVAVAVGQLVKQDKVLRFNMYGFLLLFSSVIGMIYINHVVALYLLSFGIVLGFSLISVTSLPIALYKLSSKQTVLGIGLFYGGNELADSLWEVLQVL